LSDIPRWKLIERVVAGLEACLAPDSRVEHNVKLPVLGRPDREPRQCDVLVRQGTPPRETITIVEVQARNSRPEIGDLAAWVDKMREVGAQHLMCVSEAGFPASIVGDAANKYGPTVRLMTLQQLERLQLGNLHLAPVLVHKNPRFEVRSVTSLKLDPRPPSTDKVTINQDTAFYYGDSAEQIDLLKLVAKIFTDQDTGNTPGAQREEYDRDLDLGSLGTPIWVLLEGVKHRVLRLVVRSHIVIEPRVLPLHSFSYSQEFVDGKLAWIAVASDVIDGKRMELRFVCIPTPDGFQMRILADSMTKGVALHLFDSAEARDAHLRSDAKTD
jgi:hypothetical protein